MTESELLMYTPAQQKYLAELAKTEAKYDVVLACEDNCEGWFSWSSCSVCASNLGGERHPIVFFAKGTTDIVHEGVCCVDCLCYLANGDVPEL